MKDTEFFARALELQEPWKVIEVTMDVVGKKVEVKVDCGKSTVWLDPQSQQRLHVHGYEQRCWRHLDTMQFETIICAGVPRLKYPDGHTELVKVPWAAKHTGWTLPCRTSGLVSKFSYQLILNPESNGIHFFLVVFKLIDARYGVIYITLLLLCRRTLRKSKRFVPVALSIATRKKSAIPCSPNMTSSIPAICFSSNTRRFGPLRSIAVRSLMQPWILASRGRPSMRHRNTSDSKASRGFFPKSGVPNSRASSPQKSTLISRSLLHQSPISKPLCWFREFEDASVSFSIPNNFQTVALFQLHRYG